MKRKQKSQSISSSNPAKLAHVLSSDALSSTINSDLANESSKPAIANGETKINKILELIVTLNFFSSSLFDYFDLNEVSRFDLSLTNKKLRAYWLEYPKLLNHCHSLFGFSNPIDFCISRNLCFHRLAVEKLDNSSFSKLSFFSKYLKEFCMRDCDDISQECFNNFIQTCKFLKDINFLSLANDISLQNIASSCPDLATLSFQCTTGKLRYPNKQFLSTYTRVK